MPTGQSGGFFQPVLIFVNPNRHGANQGIKQGADIAQPGYQGPASYDVHRFVTLIEKQAAKLEAASVQVGYYKAQLDSYQEQVKLTLDLQAEAARANIQEERVKELESELGQIKARWWYRFWTWPAGS